MDSTYTMETLFIERLLLIFHSYYSNGLRYSNSSINNSFTTCVCPYPEAIIAVLFPIIF